MKILIIGKLDSPLIEASKIVKERGDKVFFADHEEKAFATIRRGIVDLIMVEVNMGIAVIKNFLDREKIYLPIVACGMHHNTEIVEDAINCGAIDYITLPPDREFIVTLLSHVLKSAKEQNIIHSSNAMGNVLEIAKKIAPTNANVFIIGETGTGKEEIAKFIHAHSKRADQELVTINCAAVPKDLADSHFFGHEKGSFTGANDRCIGKFEIANNGTLFLDEITEMPRDIQGKLLRALQQLEMFRVGGQECIKLNIRFIAATNRDIQQAIEDDAIGADVVHRLGVINITVPPLRDRKEDISPLSDFFVEKYSKVNGLDRTPIISAEAKDVLNSHYWPGNVRELENVIHRAVILCDGKTIHASNISIMGTDEVNKMKDALHKTSWDYNAAAILLGISISTLKNKIRKYMNAI